MQPDTVIECGLPKPTFQCPICLDDFPSHASSTYLSCEHKVCRKCMQAYWNFIIEKKRDVQIRCVIPGCSAQMTRLAVATHESQSMWPRLWPAIVAEIQGSSSYHSQESHEPVAIPKSTPESERQERLYRRYCVGRVGACSNCGAHIERDGGCPRVKCTRCNRYFNFIPFRRVYRVSYGLEDRTAHHNPWRYVSKRLYLVWMLALFFMPIVIEFDAMYADKFNWVTAYAVLLLVMSIVLLLQACASLHLVERSVDFVWLVCNSVRVRVHTLVFNFMFVFFWMTFSGWIVT